MALGPTHLLLQHVRRLLASEPLADQQLLDRFASDRDESAFSSLVHRYGPMVLRVCRRQLRDSHEADDAFQATFLVLARKAGSIGKRESVGAWLHGVAYRVSCRLRMTMARHGGPDRPWMEEQSSPPPAEELSWREVCAALDEELQRMPAKLRGPLVLCHLQGMTRDEAAVASGMTLATLKRRLEEGRESLRQRLARRGVELSAVLLALEAASIPLPAALLDATMRAAVDFTRGATRCTGTAVVLAEGVLQTMRTSTLKLAAAVVLTLGLTGAGVGWVAWTGPGQPGDQEGPGLLVAGEDGSGKAEVRHDFHGRPLPEGAVARLGAAPDHPLNQSYAATFADGGKQLVIGGNDKGESVVRILDVATGKEVRRLAKGLWFSFAADGKTLATCDGVPGTEARPRGRWVLRYHDASGQESRVWEASLPVHALALSPDGKVLATADDECPARLWDTATGKELPRLPAAKRQTGHALAFSPDGKQLASAADGPSDPKGKPLGAPEILVWDVASGKRLHAFGGFSYARSVAFSPDGKALAGGGGIDPSLDGKTGADLGVVFLWDLASGTRSHRLEWDGSVAGTIAHAVCFGRDGTTILAGCGAGVIQCFNLRTSKRQRSLHGCTGSVHGLELSPDGRALAVSTRTNIVGDLHRLYVLDPVTGIELAPFEAGHRTDLRALAWSPDSAQLATLGPDFRVRLWNAASGRPVRQWMSPWSASASLVFGPDGKTLCLADVLERGKVDWRVRVLDTTTGQLIRERTIAPGNLALSPDGRLAVGCGPERRLYLWDTATGKEVPSGLARATAAAEDQFPGTFSAFSPDGRFLAWYQTRLDLNLKNPTGAQKVKVERDPDGKIPRRQITTTIRIWDLAADKELPPMADCTGPVAFSPDGKTVTVVHTPPRAEDMRPAGPPVNKQEPIREMVERQPDSMVLQVREIATGQVRYQVRISSNPNAAAFSPDGRLLATTHIERPKDRGPTAATRMWDTGTGKELDRLPGQSSAIITLAFSADGRRLAVGSTDGSALIWDVTRFYPAPAPVELTVRELDDMWTRLRAEDPAKALPAMATLDRDAAHSVPYLLQQLQKELPDAKRIDQLVSDLGSDQFAIRDRATRELEDLGSIAENALKIALKAGPSLDLRMRIERLLMQSQTRHMTPAQVRAQRAVEVLERIGSPAARDALKALANHAPLSSDVRAALDRLGKRPVR